MHCEFAVGIWQREQGFLRRGVRHLSFCEDVPRDDRSLVLIDGQVGPSSAQERLVGERTVQANPVQVPGRDVEGTFFKVDRTEYQV